MHQRILQGAAATLTVTLADQDGSPADASGVLTVAVTRADGTSVLPALTATVHGSTGVYSVPLTAAQTASLDLLTATWTDDGDNSAVTTQHEVVGGYYFSLAEARAFDSTLADATKYPNPAVLTRRQEVEEEAEAICDVAFVPRYGREILDGAGTELVALTRNKIRKIRSVRIYSDIAAGTFTSFTATQLAALVVKDDGTIRRTDFNVFDQGTGNVVIEYEHGWDAPPADLKDAALMRLRDRLNFNIRGVSARTKSFTAENGQTYELDTAGAFKTGDPDVDAAYSRYSYRNRDDGNGTVGPKAASRPLVFSPQRNSVFHRRNT